MTTFRFALVGWLCLASAAHAATVTFADDTFSDAAWSATKILDTTSGGAASFSAGQAGSAGNPGSFRETVHTYSLGSIVVAHAHAPATYDPSVSGGIVSVDFGYDLIHLNPPPGQAVAYSIVLVQNGNYYRAASYDTIFGASWQSFARTGLVAGDFVLIAGTGPATPDFSAGGGTIQAGFVSANTNTGGAASISRTSGIDNWRVSFHSVPEPIVSWLLGAAATVACALRMRG